MSGAVWMWIFNYLGSLTIRMHIEKDAAAQEFRGGCVIVTIILNCILFSFASHNYVLAASVSVLVVTRVQSFPSRWLSSLWNAWLAKFCALSLLVILGFFTRFLTNLIIREWCRSYKDSGDDVSAENACFSSESYTGKRTGGNKCGTSYFQFCMQSCCACPTSASSRNSFIFGWDLVPATSFHSSFGRNFPVGSPGLLVMTLLGYWLLGISEPD